MDIQPIQPVTPPVKVTPVEKVSSNIENTIHYQTERQNSKETETTISPEEINELERKVSEINQRLLGRDTKLQFQIHERTGQTVVRLVDIQTDELVKEIPPTKMLDVIGKIWDDMGIAVDRKG